MVGPREQGPSTFAGSSVASVEPEVIPKSISSKSDQSQEPFSSSSTKSSPANSDIDSELSSDKFESKTTSSSCKKLVLAKKTLSTCSHHEHSGSCTADDKGMLPKQTAVMAEHSNVDRHCT